MIVKLIQQLYSKQSQTPWLKMEAMHFIQAVGFLTFYVVFGSLKNHFFQADEYI